MNFPTYSDKILKELSEDGYQAYLYAKNNDTKDAWYKAATYYDVTYQGVWSNILFSGLDYDSPDLQPLNPLQDLPFITKEKAKQIFENQLSECRKKFLVSCEFYVRAYDLDREDFYTNLRLAYAFTASLQLALAYIYWERSINFNPELAEQAFRAEYDGIEIIKFHKTSVLDTIVWAAENEEKPFSEEALERLRNRTSFVNQMKEAFEILKSSSYLYERLKLSNFEIMTAML